jgi:hypothetical protein
MKHTLITLAAAVATTVCTVQAVVKELTPAEQSEYNQIQMENLGALTDSLNNLSLTIERQTLEAGRARHAQEAAAAKAKRTLSQNSPSHPRLQEDQVAVTIDSNEWKEWTDPNPETTGVRTATTVDVGGEIVETGDVKPATLVIHGTLKNQNTEPLAVTNLKVTGFDGTGRQCSYSISDDIFFDGTRGVQVLESGMSYNFTAQLSDGKKEIRSVKVVVNPEVSGTPTVAGKS